MYVNLFSSSQISQCIVLVNTSTVFPQQSNKGTGSTSRFKPLVFWAGKKKYLHWYFRNFVLFKQTFVFVNNSNSFQSYILIGTLQKDFTKIKTLQHQINMLQITDSSLRVLKNITLQQTIQNKPILRYFKTIFRLPRKYKNTRLYGIVLRLQGRVPPSSPRLYKPVSLLLEVLRS